MRRNKSVWLMAVVLLTLGVHFVLEDAGAQQDTLLDSAARSPEVRAKLIVEYESDPKGFTDDRLLAVAISYAKEGRFTNAVLVYKRFIDNHPRHKRALRGLGTSYLFQQHYEEAITYLRKSWSLGDVDSLSTLAAAYVRSGKYAQMEDLIPKLLEHSKGDSEIVNCLVAYAIFYKDPPDVKLVLKAFARLPDQDILLREDTTQLVSEVVSRFGRSPELEMAQLPILAKVIRGYEADRQNWPANRRILAADSYCLVSEHAKGEPIYREILKEDPDNVAALRGLGIALAYQHKFKEGIAPLRDAWSQGDKLSLSALAACHLGARAFDGMNDLIPPLLERKGDDIESLNLVIMYATAKPSPDRELFFKAIAGITDEQLLRNEEVVQNTIQGLKLFGEKRRAEHLQKLKAEQDKGKKA